MIIAFPFPSLPFPLNSNTAAASDTRHSRLLDRSIFPTPKHHRNGFVIVMTSSGRREGGSGVIFPPPLRVRGRRATVHCAARHRSDINNNNNLVEANTSMIGSDAGGSVVPRRIGRSCYGRNRLFRYYPRQRWPNSHVSLPK